MFSRRKTGQQRRRAKEQLYKSAEESGCLTFFLYLPFRVVFFYLFFPYRAFFKSGISPTSKVIHKIITAFIYSSLAVSSLTIESEIKTENQNSVYLIFTLFSGIAIAAIISLFKKKRILPE